MCSQFSFISPAHFQVISFTTQLCVKYLVLAQLGINLLQPIQVSVTIAQEYHSFISPIIGTMPDKAFYCNPQLVGWLFIPQNQSYIAGFIAPR